MYQLDDYIGSKQAMLQSKHPTVIPLSLKTIDFRGGWEVNM